MAFGWSAVGVNTESSLNGGMAVHSRWPCGAPGGAAPLRAYSGPWP
jgi:hypothetical protein